MLTINQASVLKDLDFVFFGGGSFERTHLHGEICQRNWDMIMVLY